MAVFGILQHLVLVLLAVILANCSAGGQAGPPISILNETVITVSSLNTDNITSITGAEGVASESVYLLVNVEAATPSVSARRAGAVSPLTSVSACFSEAIPACPTVTNSACYGVANADGSFSLDVTASSTDTLSLTAVDPESCEETPLLADEAIPDNVPPLGMEGYSFDYYEGAYYVLGTREVADDDVMALLRIDLNDWDSQTFLDLPETPLITGTLEDLQFITDEAAAPGRTFLIMSTSATSQDSPTAPSTYMGELSEDGSAVLKWKPFNRQGEAVTSGLTFLTAMSTEDRNCQSGNLNSSTMHMDLVFKNAEGGLGRIRNVLNSFDGAGTSIEVRDITTTASPGDSEPDYSFLKTIQDEVLAIVSYDREDENADYYMTKLAEQDLKCGTVALSPQSTMADIGEEMSPYRQRITFQYSEFEVNNVPLRVITFVNRDESANGSVKVVSYDYENPMATQWYNLSDLANDLENPGPFVAASYVGDDSLKVAFAYGLGNYFFNRTIASDFSTVTDSAFVSGTNKIINPMQMDATSDEDFILVLDRGIVDDDRSNINLYHRGDEASFE